MAAVIRLKRRVDEDPLNAFVLNCKKQRTDLGADLLSPEGNGSGASNETSTVLKFAGTFAKADNISSHLQQRLTKKEAEEAISRVHRPAIVSRNRAVARQNAQNNRFRIVNCTRSLTQTDGAEGTTIVDVEREITDSGSAVAAGTVPVVSSATVGSENGSVCKPQPRAAMREEPDYVYDLYVADDSDQQTRIPYIPDNLDDISVAIYDDPLYSSHRGGEGGYTDDEDSEDSNDENNWRNDYPDEDADVFGEGNSIDEDDMRRAVEDFDFEGDRELSSDDEDLAYFENNPPAYPPDYDEDEFCEEDNAGLNPSDVARFGTAYAKYKARIMKHIDKKQNSDQYDSEIDCGDDGRSDDDSESENFDLYD
ncbi:probable RNA polymerase II nuclear localization protein SLC7A6OS [Wyeomyia smithii]|uniref:probable RNA polymerase II nuclear localization protein SLC7A6OS n=1 Tax=Wyeomyia smithii TaxID=174621 RepID=UPI0024681A28|nr:probable RNA polymerase II nuclear localization protein SLC7A6OS [Wyeomyia smithii]